jgi:hypothetical protein
MTAIERHEIAKQAESIRKTLLTLSHRLDGLMETVGSEESGWSDAYETLSDVRSDVEVCVDRLENRFSTAAK